ncbi:MAG: hypothetical protein WDM78_13975 [Puia sp.]
MSGRWLILKANYTGAHDVVWYNQSNNKFYCVFHEGEVVNRVYYDQRGRWEHTLVGYPESHLTKNIRDLIREDFPGTPYQLYQ